MLRIVAAAYRDGWAFVEDGGRTLLVRPPYQRPGPIEVTSELVEQAVARHGFEAQTVDVADLGSLVELLKQKRVAIAEEEGTPSLTDRERRDGIVRIAPRHILERYLDRVERELLAQGKLDAALDVLSAMSHAHVKSIDDALRERVSSLIARCRDALAFRREIGGDEPPAAKKPIGPAPAMRAQRRKALARPPYEEVA